MTIQSSGLGAHSKKDVTPNLDLRACTTHRELDECVRIQREVWRFSESELIPSDVFIVALKTGGQVIGAFDGDRQIGFTLAFMAVHDNEPYLHSHFAAVLPECQGSGVGRLLKFAQREDALRRGIRRIEWTFDPLALMNAHFNLNRLGAIVRRYIPNFYGVTSSPLHGNLPTDRLVAEWLLDSVRVQNAVEGRLVPSEPDAVEVTLPRNTTELLRSGSEEALRIQGRVREELLSHFATGYTAYAVQFADGDASYLLTSRIP